MLRKIYLLIIASSFKVSIITRKNVGFEDSSEKPVIQENFHRDNSRENFSIELIIFPIEINI